jgi:transposase
VYGQTQKRGQKIGKIRITSTIPFNMHRPYTGQVKGVRTPDQGSGVCLVQAEQDVSAPKRGGSLPVGIDAGLNAFAIDSTGAGIENPRSYDHSYTRLKVLARNSPKSIPKTYHRYARTTEAS